MTTAARPLPGESAPGRCTPGCRWRASPTPARCCRPSVIETMRREGYEFQVSRPEVILRYKEGKTLEPFEEVYIETAPDVLGAVVEMLGSRRGQMIDMQDAGDAVRLRYLVPTRGLLGFRYHFMTATRGAGFLHSIFHDYLPLVGGLAGRSEGSLVAWEPGITTS